jgi:hypothetical protein
MYMINREEECSHLFVEGFSGTEPGNRYRDQSMGLYKSQLCYIVMIGEIDETATITFFCR